MSSSGGLSAERQRESADKWFLVAQVLLLAAFALLAFCALWFWWHGLDDIPEPAVHNPFIAFLMYPPLSALMMASLLALGSVTAYANSIAGHSFELYALTGGFKDEK